MGDDGLVASAVRIISCYTREDIKWGSRAFQLWNLNPQLSPFVCVDIAQKELYDSDFRAEDYDYKRS